MYGKVLCHIEQLEAMHHEGAWTIVDCGRQNAKALQQMSVDKRTKTSKDKEVQGIKCLPCSTVAGVSHFGHDCGENEEFC